MVRAIFFRRVASALILLPLSVLLGTPVAGASVVPATPEISWQTAGQLTLPFEYFKQHIFVSVSLNGKPGFVFMLDSGANQNVLNLRVARELGIHPGNVHPQRDVGFGDGSIYTASQQNVYADIDSVQVAHAMSVMDLNLFEQHFQHPTDGILGVPFFRRFVVRLDFEKKTLTLFPADHFVYRGSGVRVHLRDRRRFIVMPVVIGSSRYGRHPANVIVDTGSNVTLMLYERNAHGLELDSSLLHANAGKAYGLNGYYQVAYGSIHSLQIGNAEARHVAVDYFEPNADMHPERNGVGAIGNGILQSFSVVVFDLPHRQMILEMKNTLMEQGVVRTETTDP